jgi:hypothetical protein
MIKPDRERFLNVIKGAGKDIDNCVSNLNGRYMSYLDVVIEDIIERQENGKCLSPDELRAFKIRE